jgi:small subunit ribosomal protein S9
MPGEGNVTINKRSIDDYLKRETAKMIIRQPLELTETLGKFDIYVNVRGGGISGQAGAIKHGISRALLAVNPEFRPLLKKSGFLTRDSRVKERKKYGQPGARKRFQYSKR